MDVFEFESLGREQMDLNITQCCEELKSAKEAGKSKNVEDLPEEQWVVQLIRTSRDSQSKHTDHQKNREDENFSTALCVSVQLLLSLVGYISICDVKELHQDRTKLKTNFTRCTNHRTAISAAHFEHESTVEKKVYIICDSYQTTKAYMREWSRNTTQHATRHGSHGYLPGHAGGRLSGDPRWHMWPEPPAPGRRSRTARAAAERRSLAQEA